MRRIAVVLGAAGILALSAPAIAAPQDLRTASTADTVAKAPLDKTPWRAIELGGEPVARAKRGLEARLLLDNGALTGADGCSHVSGSYQVMGPLIQFGQLATIAGACADGDVTATALRTALGAAHVFRVKEQRLELMDRSGTILARFAAPAVKVSPSVAAPALAGTSWQLVKFQAAHGTNLTPKEPSSYTIDFGAKGKLAAVIGCHRARSTWEASGRSELHIAALALKGPACSGTLHDHLIKNLGRVRSYNIRDGHLFLALMADTGVYEYEPVKSSAKSVATQR